MLEECRKHLLRAPVECQKWIRREGASGCNCLSHGTKDGGESKTSALASFMVKFYNFPPEKAETIMNVISAGKTGPPTKRVRYCLGFMVDTSETNEDENPLRHLKVCRYSLGYLLDFRHGRWGNLRKHILNETPPSYGKKSKNHKIVGKVDCSEVEQFFSEYQTSNVLQGQVKSKRDLYILFCKGRGWRVSTSKTGSVKTTFAEPNPKPIWARSTFDSYWRKNFPHVVVGGCRKVQVQGVGYSNNNNLHKDANNNNVLGDDEACSNRSHNNNVHWGSKDATNPPLTKEHYEHIWRKNFPWLEVVERLKYKETLPTSCTTTTT